MLVVREHSVFFCYSTKKNAELLVSFYEILWIHGPCSGKNLKTRVSKDH